MSLRDDSLRVAGCQLEATEDKSRNTAVAGRLVATARHAGADLVILPEKWTGLGSPEIICSVAEPLDGGDSVEAMSAWARAQAVYLIGGSITERGKDGALYNTCLVFNPAGEVIAEYRKLHMFDVEVGGERYRESETLRAGDEIVTVDVRDWTVGLSICYDLRFPELYRILALRGASVLAIPSAFTLMTGRDHWEPLLRARAIENGCYVVAAGEQGAHGGRQTYGRSLIVDPWGTVIGQASDGEGIVIATLERARVKRARESLGSLANRRPEAYRYPDDRPAFPR